MTGHCSIIAKCSALPVMHPAPRPPLFWSVPALAQPLSLLPAALPAPLKKSTCNARKKLVAARPPTDAPFLLLWHDVACCLFLVLGSGAFLRTRFLALGSWSSGRRLCPFRCLLLSCPCFPVPGRALCALEYHTPRMQHEAHTAVPQLPLQGRASQDHAHPVGGPQGHVRRETGSGDLCLALGLELTGCQCTTTHCRGHPTIKASPGGACWPVSLRGF